MDCGGAPAMNPHPRSTHRLSDRGSVWFVRAAGFWQLHPVVRYAFAFGATVIATVLQFAAEYLVGPVTPPFLVFFPMVIMVALVAGFGPAVSAIAMTIAALWILPLNGSPVGKLEVPPVLLVIFGFVAFTLGAVAELLRRVRAEVDQSRREAAFRQSEERFHHMADAMPQLVWSAKLDGSVIYYNSRAVEYHGIEVTPDENWKWQPTVHPEDLQMTIDAWETAVREGSTYQLEHRLRMADDSFRWHLSRAFLVESKDGGKEWIGTATDIDDVKKTEQALRVERERLSVALDAGEMGVYDLDMISDELWWSPGVYRVFGVSPESFKPTRELFLALIHPDDRERMWNHLEETIRNREPFVDEFRTILGDGSVRWVANRAVTQFSAEGRPVRNYGVAIDITDRRRAADASRESGERMRLATEATGVGIWEWDMANNRILWDPQMFRIYGIEPTADGMVDYSVWSGAVHPEDRDLQEQLIRDTGSKGLRGAREFRIIRASDGDIRYLQSVETVRTSYDGKPLCMVGTNLDITDRKRTEDALNEEARRKDEFLAMLSHELRNPLNAIRNAVMVSKEAISDPDARRMAGEVIDRQSRQLGRMVNDLLDVARVNRGRIELKLEPQDLGTVLRHAISATWPLIEERRHGLQTEIEPGLTVSGDATRLEQIFVNLINNATKYTPEGGVIRLAAMRDGSDAVVSLHDNGMGIPSELLPHVFDLFRQADSSLDRSQGGLGIGLSVVKTLVYMHQGHIVVDSPGRNAGTTVTIRLPLLAQSASGIEASTPVGNGQLKQGTRVLIVDDHVDSAQVLEMLLEMHEFEVRLAHSGPEGLQAARDFAPEVLLLDLGLPGFDGFELVKRLRQEPACGGALFIAVSGYAQSADRQRSLEAGFHRHCAKPVDVSELLEVIRSRAM